MTNSRATFDDHAAAAALAHCREVTRRCARNFYYGLKLSPEPQRSALYVIYAWMRRADDIVDSRDGHTESELLAKLDEFQRMTDAALAGSPEGDDPLWVGLASIAAKFSLPAECFRLMLDGQRDDLHRRAYATFHELRDYCYRVASTVGLLCIEVWGYSDRRAKDMAIDRGIAFQLTNILRDFAEDFDAGRVYLPSEDFEAHGVTPREVRQWSKPVECERFMRAQIDRCEAHYQRSAELDEFIPGDFRPTLWAMTSIYHALLSKMSEDPTRIVAPVRLRLSSFQKGLIAFKARWHARSKPTPASARSIATSRTSGD